MQPQYVKEQSRHQTVSGAEVAFREHASRIEAKKVVDMGGIGQLPLDGARSEAPSVLAVSGVSVGADLEPNTYYRLISTTGVYFNLSVESGTAVAATAADTYLPADQSVVIYTDDKWRRIDLVQAVGAGSAQLQRVLM